MIIKIRNEFGTEAWFIRSGIEEVIYDHITYDKIESPVDRHFDNNERDKSINYVRMIVKFENGKEEVWITQVATYLLNDEGKTIERLV